MVEKCQPELRSGAECSKVDQIRQQLKIVYDKVLQEPLPDNLIKLTAALAKRG
ncbi:MAG: NepR family anti-sigma factor [Defluviicoccus sp.]